MKPDATPATTDTAVADKATPRFAPKRLIVGGGAAAALLLVAAAAVLLWPKDAEVRATHAAARKAATAASAAAATAAANVQVASETSKAGVPADGVVPAASALRAARHDGAAPADPAVPALAHKASAEEPLDRLRRRLGQVLGPKGEVDAAQTGEWRVLTRGSGVSPVAHVAVPHAAAAPAQERAAPAATAWPSPPALPAHWDYEGRGGPQAWGRLKPEFSLCGSGARQSPIDIRDGLALDLEPLQIDYQPGAFGVIDNGHTVQVNVAPGNFIEIIGRRYELQQFHFHRPSEERINGRQFEMSVHLVHKDAEGRLAVVALLLERGAAQPLLQTVWNHLPLEKHEERAARVPIDLNRLLPADRRYYTYMGSLTTPPCSEGVLWVVMQQPLPVSAQQIDIFARLYPMNARPIQRAAGRLIKQSN